jgi:lysophospholipase L1-like esterase
MTVVRGWSVVGALGTVGLLAGQARAAARVPTHVACVGDSITAGYGASSPAKSYPADLQTLFGAAIQVKNFGHNGTTMLSKGFGDLPYEDQAEYPAATSFVSGAGANATVDVVIMLGTNDSKPMNWTPAGKPKNDQQYLSDYRAMVDHFLALTPKPVVFLALPLASGETPCCSINGTVIHDEVIPLIKQLADEKHLPTIDLNTPTSNHNEYFVDGTHPNDAAYAIVAQIFHDGLLQDLASGGSGGTGGNNGGNGGNGGNNGGNGGSAGRVGSAGAPGGSGAVGAGGSLGVSGAGQAGVGSNAGGAAAKPENHTKSSGCSLSLVGRSGGAGQLAPVFMLLSLIGLRRRAVLHARPRS